MRLRGKYFSKEPVSKNAAVMVELVPVNLGDDGNVSRNVGKTNSETPQPPTGQIFDKKKHVPKILQR